MWEREKVRMWEGALLRPASAGLRRVAPLGDQVRSVLRGKH